MFLITAILGVPQLLLTLSLHLDSTHLHLESTHLHLDSAYLHLDSAHLHTDSAHLHLDSTYFHLDSAYLHTDTAYLHHDSAYLHADSSLLDLDSAHKSADSIWLRLRCLGVYNLYKTYLNEINNRAIEFDSLLIFIAFWFLIPLKLQFTLKIESGWQQFSQAIAGWSWSTRGDIVIASAWVRAITVLSWSEGLVILLVHRITTWQTRFYSTTENLAHYYIRYPYYSWLNGICCKTSLMLCAGWKEALLFLPWTITFEPCRMKG